MEFMAQVRNNQDHGWVVTQLKKNDDSPVFKPTTGTLVVSKEENGDTKLLAAIKTALQGEIAGRRGL